ncbi:MAG: ribosomal protein S18-alanine N-acetyltransferase [Acidobacteria bacterium]|nr:ribosomal protein S18-alanine N-acetyltransferase [Acidobacteriota bacterium]
MMSIRRMLETDLDAVERIATESSPDAATWTRHHLLAMLANPSLYEAWVAEQAGAVVGFLYFHFVGEEAELDNLAVSPAWRRRGIAAELLETAWQRATERAHAAMFLEVRRSNTAALRLYQRAGFLNVGVRTSYYTNPSEDAIQLVRKRL